MPFVLVGLIYFACVALGGALLGLLLAIALPAASEPTIPRWPLFATGGLFVAGLALTLIESVGTVALGLLACVLAGVALAVWVFLATRRQRWIAARAIPR